MTLQEAEAALQAWAAATGQRDELVRAAHYEAGMSKNRISALSGIARTTVDRILETPAISLQERLTGYLDTFIAQWPRRQPLEYHHPDSGPVARQYSAEEVAQWLLNDGEYRALKLGTFFGTPEGEMLAEAVAALAPPPYERDAELLIAALRLASAEQQREQRRKIFAGVAAGGVAALLFGSAGK